MAGRKPGAAKTGGRQKGSLNKINPSAAEIMAKYGVSGIDGLCRIAKGMPLKCLTFTNKETGEFVVALQEPTFDQMQAAIKELAQYEAPKLKAVEHSGDLTQTHEHWIAGISNPPKTKG